VGEREPWAVEPATCHLCPVYLLIGTREMCGHPDWPAGADFNDAPDMFPAACPLRPENSGPLLVRLPVPGPGGEPKP